MSIYNVHGGHSLQCRGASGFLDEVNEDRKVKNKVIELLRAAGNTVYDCTTTLRINVTSIMLISTFLFILTPGVMTLQVMKRQAE